MSERSTPTAGSLESLRKNPTTFEWLVELRRVLNGERERSLLQLQSVAAYLNKILARSDDVALAHACFSDALRQTVQAWHPNDRSSKEYLACMLDLITAYLPLEGAAKVLGLLNRWGDFSDSIESSGGYGADSDLNLQMLVVLESYFQVAPHQDLKQQSLLFQNYVEVLESYLVMPKSGGYVASRLIELGLIEVSDERIGKLTGADPSALYELLSFIFSEKRQPQLKADLKALVAHVNESTKKTKRVFEEALTAYGAGLVRRASGWEIVLPEGHKIQILDSSARARAASEQGTLRHAQLTAQVSQIPKLLNQGGVKERDYVWSIFEQTLINGPLWVDHFASVLKQSGGSLQHDESGVRIAFPGGSIVGKTLTQEAKIAYVVWYSRSTKAPPKQRIIQELTASARSG